MARSNGNGSLSVKPRAAKKLSVHDKIELRAYEIYLERNGAPGDPMQDWIRAEREVSQKSRKTTKKVAAPVL